MPATCALGVAGGSKRSGLVFSAGMASDCGHYTITEETMSVMLAKVEQITQKATISYHRCRWPKAQQIDEQQPTAAVAEVMETLNKSARK